MRICHGLIDVRLQAAVGDMMKKGLEGTVRHFNDEEIPAETRVRAFLCVRACVTSIFDGVNVQVP